jgi:NCS1 family nucleobase:cation symporter-1
MATEVVETQRLEPVAAESRRLGAWGFFVLWGDLGIGLLVLLAGSFLVPALSLPQALGAILLGSVIGVTLLGLTGIVGSQTGLPTMV